MDVHYSKNSIIFFATFFKWCASNALNQLIKNISMRKICLSILLFLSLVNTINAQQQKLSEKKITTVHAVERNTDYKIYIQLPKSYGKLMAKYPVIVLFDAQDKTLFDYTSSAIDRMMTSNDIPEAIFIGIVQQDRSKELNADQNETISLQFLNFIKNDLTAYLKQNYTVNNYYTLIGHSLGGLFVTNAMMTYPDTFKSAISISGALSNTSKTLHKLENYLDGKIEHARVRQKYYFSVGDEGFQDKIFRPCVLMADSLLLKHNPDFLSWHFDEFKGFNHMTTPLVSVPAGLAFIFHDWYFSEDVAMDVLITHKTDPIKALEKQKDSIETAYGTNIALPPHVYYQFADYYLSNGQIDKAKLLTEQIIALYPGDDEAFALMADVLIKQGDKSGALAALKVAQSKSPADKYKERIAKITDELVVK